MPIIVGFSEDTGPEVVAPPDELRTSWSWVDAEGSEWPLSAEVFPRLMPGLVGLDMPPVVVRDSEFPIVDGGLFEGVRYGIRDVILPVVLWAADAAQFDVLRQRLFRMFDPRAEGVLRVRPAGRGVRELRVRCVGGLSNPESGDQGALNYAVFGVELRAYDPLWYGQSASQVWELASGSEFFPGPPFTLSPASVLGNVIVVNDGAQPVWPTFTVYGPCTAVTFTGPQGDVFKLQHTLTFGQTVRISTDPRTVLSQRVVSGTGSNLWGSVVGGSSPFAKFWSLPQGESTVSVTATGCTFDQTRVVMGYRFGYLTW
jgi:hypothetical protein